MSIPAAISSLGTVFALTGLAIVCELVAVQRTLDRVARALESLKDD
jgi:hypothetical protein